MFVPLAAVAEPEMVVPRIAAAVGVTIEGSQPALDAVIEDRRHTDLLVLDNLEQVVAVAPELDELLGRSPAVEILATSRTVLRLRLSASYPRSRADRSRAVRSAVARPARRITRGATVRRSSTAVRYDFALTDDNALAIAEICRRVDGLPSRHRARRGASTAARHPTPCSPGSNESSRCPRHRPGRSSRASTHAARHRRVEHRTARRCTDGDAWPRCRSSSTAGRSSAAARCSGSANGRSTCSTASPVTVS